MYKWISIDVRTRRIGKRRILANVQEVLHKVNQHFQKVNPHMDVKIFEQIFIPSIMEEHNTEGVLNQTYIQTPSHISGIAFIKYNTDYEQQILQAFRENYIRTAVQPGSQVERIMKHHQNHAKKFNVENIRVGDMIEADGMIGCVKSIEDDMITVQINSMFDIPMDYVTHRSNVKIID